MVSVLIIYHLPSAASPETLPSQSQHNIKSSILKFNLGCALVRLVQFKIELVVQN
nr:MAG TPA: hypothetical protein [Caudoviricetes sp.]